MSHSNNMSQSGREVSDDPEMRAFLDARAEELASAMLPMHEATSRLEHRVRKSGMHRLLSITVPATAVIIGVAVTLAVVGGLRTANSTHPPGVGASSSPIEAVTQVAGIYRSAEPLLSTMCVAVMFEPGASTIDLWWWEVGKTGCDSRTSDVVRTLASLDTVSGPGGESVKVAYWLDLMTGEQRRVEFIVGPAPVGAPLPALVTEGRVSREVPLVRINEVDPPFRPID